MDPLHHRLARLALATVGGSGFCLAGGYAVQEHGFLERPSEDVDLFTTAAGAEQFPDAVVAVIRAYEADGLDVTVTINNAGFARLHVVDPTTGETSKVELGIDWRVQPPVMLDLGPVLHPDDAVGNKLCALYARAQARDYVDVDAVLRSGRYDGNALLSLARDHDPGFDDAMFVVALRAIHRLPEEEFTAYGLTAADTASLKERIVRWASLIEGRH